MTTFDHDGVRKSNHVLYGCPLVLVHTENSANLPRHTHSRWRLKYDFPSFFRETHEKTKIHSFPRNYTKSYRIKKQWVFEPELSNGKLSDNITSINLPVLASQHQKRDSYWESLMLDTTYFR